MAALLTFAQCSIFGPLAPLISLIKRQKMNQNEEILSENQEASENVAGNTAETGQNQAGAGQAAELAKLQSELAEKRISS